MPYSCCGTVDRYDLRRLDWNIVYCAHGTLQEASIMCNSQGSRHVSQASYLRLWYSNAWSGLAWTHNTFGTDLHVMLTHTHACGRLLANNTCTGSSPRPHSLHTEIPFISSYWLLLYPVAWLDHTRQGLTSSEFLPCSFAPSLPPLLARPPRPSSPPPPPTPLSCLPFISFHLSGLLNSTTGMRVRCFDGTAAPQHKSIFTPFTYFHANKWLALSSILRA